MGEARWLRRGHRWPGTGEAVTRRPGCRRRRGGTEDEGGGRRATREGGGRGWCWSALWRRPASRRSKRRRGAVLGRTRSSEEGCGDGVVRAWGLTAGMGRGKSERDGDRGCVRGIMQAAASRGNEGKGARGEMGIGCRLGLQWLGLRGQPSREGGLRLGTDGSAWLG